MIIVIIIYHFSDFHSFSNMVFFQMIYWLVCLYMQFTVGVYFYISFVADLIFFQRRVGLRTVWPWVLSHDCHDGFWFFWGELRWCESSDWKRPVRTFSNTLVSGWGRETNGTYVLNGISMSQKVRYTEKLEVIKVIGKLKLFWQSLGHRWRPWWWSGGRGMDDPLISMEPWQVPCHNCKKYTEHDIDVSMSESTWIWLWALRSKMDSVCHQYQRSLRLARRRRTMVVTCASGTLLMHSTPVH